MDDVVIDVMEEANYLASCEDLDVARITLRVKRMLVMMDKEALKEMNEMEITEKYLKFWKGGNSADTLEVLREKLAKELLSFCDLEIRKADELRFKTIQDISDKM